MSCNQSSDIGIDFDRVRRGEPRASAARTGRALQVFAVAMAAAGLAACAQAPGVTGRQASVAGGRQASLESHRKGSLPANRHAVAAADKGDKRTADASGATYGLASYYSYDPHTASGEKFDSRELTAAHRTLPFGTRVRVTDVATGKSVMVRVNDRGPFVPGRVVDISHSAAQTLGITGRGVAKVKLDVVE